MSFGYSFLSLGMSIYQLVTCESLDSMEADAATSRMHGDRRRGGGGGGGAALLLQGGPAGVATAGHMGVLPCFYVSSTSNGN